MMARRCFIAALILAALALMALLAAPRAAAEEAWRWAEGQPLGSELPNFKLTNHKGKQVKLSKLDGKIGTLLIFSRSADW